MKVAAAVAVLIVLAVVAQSAPVPVQPTPVQPAAGAPGADAATLTIQFDNRKSTVLDSRKRQAIINALAQSVFLVAPSQVTPVGGVDQSRLLGSQSVVTFKAVGPTTNKKTVLANCEANTKGFLVLDSPAKKAVNKATDTWWPGDAVKIQKANCAKA